MSYEVPRSLKSQFTYGRDIYPECGPGWLDLIQNTINTIDEHIRNLIHKNPNDENLKNFSYLQIKEKYGGLRIYTSYTTEYIEGVIDLAEAMSYTICENTGKPGVLCMSGGWMKTLCHEEAASLGYKPYSREDRLF